MNRRLQVLDAQRGLCALFVALFHARGLSHFSGLSFVQGSWLFVDFFFVLSGFVIALVYLDEIDGVPALVGFVIRRFGRLWPLHAFVLERAAVTYTTSGQNITFSVSDDPIEVMVVAAR